MEPKLFNGNNMQAHAWLSTFKRYFIASGLTYKASDAAKTLAVCQYAVLLMAGNAARWMDRLEVQGHTPNSFPEFEKLLVN